VCAPVDMEQSIWILWILLGAFFMVAEIFTLGFVLFWFGIGAVAAAAVSYIGLGFGWQFLAFAVVSVALTAVSRTIFSKYFEQDGGHTEKMGMDSLPGQIGTVTAASKGALNVAAVKVFGSVWTAYPADGETLLGEGEKVEVVEVRGSSIYVRPAGPNELPGWRDE
jgi:membrane protein implicated in regulation of membrane protease activity